MSGANVVDVFARGGPWLGAVRSWIQRRCHNGERVTWGSRDVLKPNLTVNDVERAAAEAVTADRNRNLTNSDALVKAAIERAGEWQGRTARSFRVMELFGIDNDQAFSLCLRHGVSPTELVGTLNATQQPKETP